MEQKCNLEQLRSLTEVPKVYNNDSVTAAADMHSQYCVYQQEYCVNKYMQQNYLLFARCSTTSTTNISGALTNFNLDILPILIQLFSIRTNAFFDLNRTRRFLTGFGQGQIKSYVDIQIIALHF